MSKGLNRRRDSEKGAGEEVYSASKPPGCQKSSKPNIIRCGSVVSLPRRLGQDQALGGQRSASARSRPQPPCIARPPASFVPSTVPWTPARSFWVAQATSLTPRGPRIVTHDVATRHRLGRGRCSGGAQDLEVRGWRPAQELVGARWRRDAREQPAWARAAGRRLWRVEAAARGRRPGPGPKPEPPQESGWTGRRARRHHGNKRRRRK